MAIKDKLLENSAKAQANISFNVPAAFAIGSDEITPDTIDGSTEGEFDRLTFSENPSVLDAVATFRAVRNGATAANEYINALYLVDSSVAGGASDVLTEQVISSLLHTTSFDIIIEQDVEYQRI